jgi:putative ABC transport system permease protein
MKWSLFTGAFVSVTLGVALVQSSLLLLITAATMDAPAGLSAADRFAFEDNATGAVSLLGVVLGAAVFLAMFIISSTFAFTVNQRRRDLALLRLVGAGRGQVRRKLLGEALALGTLGAAAGVPAGVATMAFQGWLLRRLGFVPDGFAGQWRSWILAVSLGVGVLLAVSGVLVAARRAGRVRPLEALRDTGEAARVMTASRWFFGLLFLGGALALIILAPLGGTSGGTAMAMNVAMPAAVAVAALGPLVVPLFARLLPTGGGVLGTLARANLGDGRRRNASVAAPLIVLTALAVGNAGASTSFTASGIAEQRRDIRADLVVEGTGPIGEAVAAVPGVAAASTETSLTARITAGTGEDRWTEAADTLVIDPAQYVAVHASAATVVAALHGRQAVVGGGWDIPVHETVLVELPQTDLGRVPVVAEVPEPMSGGPGLLLPAGLVPAGEVASAPTRSFVQLAPGADRAAVRAALSRAGTVTGVQEWLRADAAKRSSINDRVLVVVLGVGGLYALIGVINATVIGATTRRREFAEARVTGLTRGQVLRAALLESSTVTAAGLLLGGVAACTALLAAATTTRAVTGVTTVDIPWTMIVALVVLAFAVTGATSLLTSWAATRARPVTLLGAHE